ncbi:MAG: hypothetical protein IPP91_07165 [Betaproteobacteria bacterium]|nr:hypothetical protein [Betaproteobacteria bacterium]
MTAPPGDGKDLERAGEAFAADMKARLEQGQADGLSPDQLREQLMAHARDEARRQAPQVAAKVRSWWTGMRNFLVVGALAAGLAIGLALSIEHRYASPLCGRYAAQHGLEYRGLAYPSIGRSSSTTSLSGSCILFDVAGHRRTVSLDRIEPDAVIGFLVGFGLLLEVTVPVLFVLVALVAVGVGRLRRSPAA